MENVKSKATKLNTMLRDQDGTNIIDIIEYILKQKSKWAGHIASMKDNRWTKCCTERNQGEGRNQGDVQAEDSKTT